MDRQNGESLYECGISSMTSRNGDIIHKKETPYMLIFVETPLGVTPLYGISPQEVGTILPSFPVSTGAEGEAWNTAMYSDA